MFFQNSVKDLSLSASVHVTPSFSFVEFEGSEVITGCAAIGRLNETTTDGSHSPHVHHTHIFKINIIIVLSLDYNAIYVKMKSRKFKIFNKNAHNIQVDV